jgi:hypothetical protein
MPFVHHQAEFEVLQQARKLQQCEAFQKTYDQWADTRGTHSQTVRALGLRRTR